MSISEPPRRCVPPRNSDLAHQALVAREVRLLQDRRNFSAVQASHEECGGAHELGQLRPRARRQRSARLGEGPPPTMRDAPRPAGRTLAVVIDGCWPRALGFSSMSVLTNVKMEGTGLFGLLYSAPNNSCTLRATLSEKSYFRIAHLCNEIFLHGFGLEALCCWWGGSCVSPAMAPMAYPERKRNECTLSTARPSRHLGLQQHPC